MRCGLLQDPLFGFGLCAARVDAPEWYFILYKKDLGPLFTSTSLRLPPPHLLDTSKMVAFFAIATSVLLALPSGMSTSILNISRN